MSIQTVEGNLKDGCNLIVPGTMQHVDELTTERRDNPDLRKNWFYTADGSLYTVQKKEFIWAITREPQNLVLSNIDEAFRQLTQNGNYFPEPEEARVSLKHADTVRIDLKGLKLVQDTEQYGHFEVDPKKAYKLNSQQILVAKRLFGPDDDNFGKNMEMFAEAEKSPWVFVLMPDYVQKTLKDKNKEFLGRASWLYDFSGNSYFIAYGRYVYYNNRLRGVRRVSEANVNTPAGRDVQNGSAYRIKAEDPLKKHLEAILADPKGTIRILNDNEAASFASIISGYLSSKEQ